MEVIFLYYQHVLAGPDDNMLKILRTSYCTVIAEKMIFSIVNTGILMKDGELIKHVPCCILCESIPQARESCWIDSREMYLEEKEVP